MIMNSKRSKRHKSAPKKSENIKDDGAEVFVLPPNLLEKLGIQLGNIQSTHECPTQTYKTDLSAVQTKITSKENNHHSEIVSLNSERSSPIQKETSILETASLMKESVFLSPTFVPTVANVIAGEVEIANGCKPSEKTATSTIDQFDTEHNLVDSFDIQQIMNSNNENGVIEFAEKILQSHENQVQKLQAQEKDIDKREGVYSITRDANLDTTIAIQDVPAGIPSQNIVLKKNTHEMEIVPDPHLIQGAIPSIESNVIKKSLNETTISTDTQLYPCMDKQIPEEQALADDIEDCEKITLEDLEINKSLHDNLLSSEIESFQPDFLDSVNCENDSEARIVNMSQSAVAIIKAENTTKNKIQLISQEIVNLKDCKIASPLNINNLIPVTIDTIISTRKDIKSENQISKHIEIYKPLSCDFKHDKTKENTSHVKKNKNIEKMACITDHDSVVITDHDSMDLTDKIQSQGYSKGADLDSNNEIIIPKHVNTISLLSVNNNTISNVLYDKSEPDSNYTLDIPCTKSEENVTNKPKIQKLELKIPSNNIDITPEGGISLIKYSHTGLISNDASIGSMTKIKLDEEMKRNNKHLPSLVNAKINKEKANQSINGPSKSKSCVQGVEKPGGDNPVDQLEFSINKEGLKTYQRVKKSNKEMNNYSIGCDTLNVVLNNDIDSHENRVVNSCDGVEEYCLCNDFGHLTNYDDNDVYEHIHFWQTESVSCDPEIIFGIYYEDTMVFNDNSQGNVTDVDEILEKETTPICWQSISTKKSDNDDDEESYLYSSTDNTRENQPLKNNQERNYISETKVTTEVVEHCTNIDENINIPSLNEYETANSNLNAGTAVNELISETNVSKTNMTPLQPVIGETIFSETNNEKANETAKLHLITNAEVKSKNFKNNITSHQLKPHNDEKHMKTVSENNQLEDASPSHPYEQLLQVPLHQPEDDIFSYQTNKDSQLENMDVVNVNKNMSDTNVINKKIIDPQPDTAVQSETPMDIQELNLTCEKSTQEPLTGLKGQRTAIEAVSASDMNEVEIPPTKKTVYCGVCTQLVAEVDWTNHATQKHNSIAWKFGQTIDFDDEQFLGVLIRKIKKNGILECSICNFKINHLATFILHLEKCVQTKIAKDVEKLKTVKCAVCMIDIPVKDWSKHLIKHNYLAWIDGEPELDLNDKNMVRMHLQSLCEVLGRLTCKCGARRSQVLGFLNHLSICQNQVSYQDSVRCGVCRRIMDSKFWNDHIKEHNYLAWKDGEPALDMEDDSKLRRHLSMVSKELGGLTCQICGQKRKYGKKYLVHIRECKLENTSAVTDSAIHSVTSPEVTLDSSLAATVKQESTDNPEIPDKPNKPLTSENVDEGSNPVETANTSVVCGVCNNNVEVTNWITHIEEGHDYLAWKFGEKPLDLENESEVLQHLKEVISKCKVLVCKKCGLSRKYAKHYMNHIKQCDGNVQHANTSSNTTLELNTTVECSRLGSDSSRRESTDQVRAGRRRKRAQIGNTSAVTDSTIHSVTSPEVTLDSSLAATVKLESTDNTEIPDIPNKPQTSENVDEGSNPVETANTSVVCGVCNNNVEVTNWITHIEEEHDYLAWKFGEKPLDLENESEVLQHLKEVISKCKVLVCKKCGLSRKYAKHYMNHMKQCDGNVQHANTSSNTTLELNTTVECSRLGSDSSRRKSTEQVRAGRRRKRAQISSDFDEEDNVVLSKRRRSVVPQSKSVRCGVCKMDIQENMWYTHIEKEHQYLAWKEGETPLNIEDEKEVWSHLLTVSQILDKLICYKCNYTRKKPKVFLKHIKNCSGTGEEITGITDQSTQESISANEYIEFEFSNPDVQTAVGARVKVEKEEKTQVKQKKKTPVKQKKETPDISESELVICAVCKESVKINIWIQHIKQEHNYLAWIEGKPALNLNDEDAVREYLRAISKKENGLVCNKCEVVMKYPKAFLKHVENCSGQVHSSDLNIVNSSGLIKCGVCSKDMESRAWIKHIQVAHNYLAWRADETPIDLDDENAVRDHLTKVLRSTSHLICAKCGFTRRYAIYYMAHLETCKGLPPAEVFEDKKSLLSKNEGLYECAMCHKKILPKHWKKHAFDEHYNVTWIVGDIPIDLKSPYGADKYLKEYQRHKKLVCNICGESRASLMGFYVHIITCGKTEEQMDIYKEDCTVCGQRYFGVYRSLHMATHRQQEITKLLDSEMNVLPESDEESPTVIGRRKAAEKANSVIEKYQKSVSKVDYAYKCDNCSFSTDLKKHFQRHKCDLDADAASEQSEDDESDEYVEHPSDLAEEEEISTTKKEAPRQSWMRIRMLNWDAYYERLIDTFRHIHLTEDRLFSEWLISQYSFVSEDRVKEYMPKLQQSCKVLLNRHWEQFEIFEGKRDNRVHSMFVGGSIQRIRWVPCELDPDVERNFLAVSAHLSKDVPRHNYDELPTHPGLIQIWDMGAFNENVPKFALGVAHDYGAVWDMDWCPSGARGNFKNSEKQNEWSRLGLLAIACSNGSAYILSVPYPDSIRTSSENLFVKLKHVAELRICSTESDRKRYQATAISWSKKKNHSEIVVAYSDGTIARYDLTNSSPLLKTSEDDVTIYYPYHDERSLNACVTGVDSFPGHGSVVDAVCGSSPTGAVLAGGGPYAARVTSHLPSADALFTPAWPTAMISSDEGLMHVTPNELDWHGCGRKLSTLCGGAACGLCGRVIAYTPPLLRVARHFPPWSEINRRAVASINVVLLLSKRKLLKQTTDELSVKIEPITYEDCVNKYGVEFNILQKFKISGHLKEPSPERFPLADVTSMAYCTSQKFHDKVAVATYSGHIFIFKPAA